MPSSEWVKSLEFSDAVVGLRLLGHSKVPLGVPFLSKTLLVAVSSSYKHTAGSMRTPCCKQRRERDCHQLLPPYLESLLWTRSSLEPFSASLVMSLDQNCRKAMETGRVFGLRKYLHDFTPPISIHVKGNTSSSEAAARVSDIGGTSEQGSQLTVVHR